MQSLLIISSVVALAFAGPTTRGLVNPGPAGPAPAPEAEPIAVGPAILDFEPIAGGPAPVDIVEESVSTPIGTAPVATPLVQIILNINADSQVHAPEYVVPGLPIDEAPTQPVNVVETAPEPVEIVLPIVPEVVPEPVEIGTPVLPSPEVVPEPVVIGTPVLPSPVVVLPEELN